MKNNAGIDNSVLEGFEEFLKMGLSSSIDVFSRLVNTDVNIEPDKIVSEKVEGLVSFGTELGIVVELTISGAISGKAAIVIQNNYAKNTLGILMSAEQVGGEGDEIDEMAMGTYKEITGQMTAAFAEAATNFFGAVVKIEAVDIFDLSEECEEIAEIFECPNDTNIYSVISKFNIGGKQSGTFNIEIDHNTFNNVMGQLNRRASMGSGSYGYSNMLSRVDSFGRPISVMKDSINVQSAQFPSFADQDSIDGMALLQGNMDLLMDVPLNVTIEIGKTRKKMRDIMEFAQGTVIDLEKQAGAPVDVVVNGQLIARGDVVVIDDNFGVRITEIIGNNAFIPKPE